jgi:cell division protease FtsH
MSRQPGDLKPRSPDRQNGATPGSGPDRSWRWVLMVLIAVVALAVLVSNVMSATSPPTVKYSQFVTELQNGQVNSAQINSNNGEIQFTDANGNVYQTQGPAPLQDPNQVQMLQKYLSGKDLTFTTPGTNWFISLLPDIVLGAAFIVLIIWMA